MERKWVRDNVVALLALLCSLGAGAYGYVKDSSIDSYNIKQLLEQNTEINHISTSVIKAQGDIESLRAYSINHSKRISSIEQSQNLLLTDQRVTNEILKNMTQVSQELSINVKELTKVVERVARLEERVRVVEEDENRKDKGEAFKRGR